MANFPPPQEVQDHQPCCYLDTFHSVKEDALCGLGVCLEVLPKKGREGQLAKKGDRRDIPQVTVEAFNRYTCHSCFWS